MKGSALKYAGEFWKDGERARSHTPNGTGGNGYHNGETRGNARDDERDRCQTLEGGTQHRLPRTRTCDWKQVFLHATALVRCHNPAKLGTNTSTTTRTPLTASGSGTLSLPLPRLLRLAHPCPERLPLAQRITRQFDQAFAVIVVALTGVLDEPFVDASLKHRAGPHHPQVAVARRAPGRRGPTNTFVVAVTAPTNANIYGAEPARSKFATPRLWIVCCFDFAQFGVP